MKQHPDDLILCDDGEWRDRRDCTEVEIVRAVRIVFTDTPEWLQLINSR